MNKIWVVYGTTESGDDWRMVFKNRPTEDQILLEIESDDWLREEYEAECIQGWRIEQESVVDNQTE